MSLKKNAGNISRLSDKRAKGGVKCENIVCELESERERESTGRRLEELVDKERS